MTSLTQMTRPQLEARRTALGRAMIDLEVQAATTRGPAYAVAPAMQDEYDTITAEIRRRDAAERTAERSALYREILVTPLLSFPRSS